MNPYGYDSGNMLCKIFISYVILSFMQNGALILSIYGYANHKDMSEFCKRQVSPSMLFGASLDDSHLNVIYYTKLNVPYSCVVTIRTEPPYVIVLVIDVINEQNLRDVCSKNKEPMTVYHMMPSYGGYWGQLPAHLSASRPKTNKTRAYTLKTTTEPTTSYLSTTQEENMTDTEYTQKIPTWVEEFVITKEIPLMNISGNFQLHGRPIQHVEDLLDDDDVTPKRSGDYVTSLVPLAKFSPMMQTRRQMHFNEKEGNPVYELIDPNIREDSITIDPRLFYTTARKRILTKKSKWTANRRKHFNYKQNLLKDSRNNFYHKFFSPRSTTFKTYNTLKVLEEKMTQTVANTNSPEKIDNINIFNINLWNKDTTKYSEINYTSLNRDAGSSRMISTGTLEKKANKFSFSVIKNNTSTLASKMVISTQTTKRELVDRESWENIVKVAPVLATLLNSTGVTRKSRITGSLKRKKKGGSNRMKKSFQAIDFEKAEPRKLDHSVLEYYDATELKNYLFMYNTYLFDNFERTDDDTMEDRKSMQNVTSNRGELILNICDLNPQKGTTWIKVLDTSEIILSLNNFTLKHVKLIVTPGLPLFEDRAQCLGQQVECQISGTRVCIERTVACDGVPNCGSNSTYDEDRVLCELDGTRHVAVAALACLAVVLAAAYALYHWVARCVPKVSQGFFVYTDQAENTLLLHTVMRSPNDVDVEPEISLSGQFSFVDLPCPDIAKGIQENICKRILRKCINSITCNIVKKGSAEATRRSENIEQIELTEMELQKIMQLKDEIIQTESSLEIKTIDFNDRLDETPKDNNNVKSSKELDFLKYVNEKPRNLRISLESKKDSPELLQDTVEEAELESIVYQGKPQLPVVQKKKPKHTKTPQEINPIESIEKHLRFLENPTLIPDRSDSQNFEIDGPSISGIVSREPSTNIERKESREIRRNYWKLKRKKSKKPRKI